MSFDTTWPAIIIGVAIGLCVFYWITHFEVIKADENGQRERFGKKIGDSMGPDWYLLGPFIKIKRAPSGAIPIRIPGTNEEIQKADEDNIQPGKVAPIRITHAEPEAAIFLDKKDGRFKRLAEFEDPEKARKELASGPLNKQATTEATAFILARIDPRFIYEFYRYSGSIEEAIASLRDVSESAMSADLSKVTPAQVELHKRIFSYRLLVALEIHAHERPGSDWVALEDFRVEDMEKDLERIEQEAMAAGGKRQVKASDSSWGLLIDKAEIKNLDPGETVNRAMAEANASVSKRQETVQNAVAEAQATEIRGTAEGNADKARGEGRASAIKAWGLALQEPGAREAAILETTEKVASAAGTLILTQNPLDIVTAALTKKLAEPK